MKTNQLGISADYAHKINEQLNELLSNIQIFYMNVRGYHWNIVGKHFFKLHEKFEELYDDLNEKADEVAERILMLEGTPLHAFSDYLKVATIKESKNKSSDSETIKGVLEGLALLLDLERKISSEAADNGDEGTVDLMTGYISGQEKLVWMLHSFMK